MFVLLYCSILSGASHPVASALHSLKELLSSAGREEGPILPSEVASGYNFRLDHQLCLYSPFSVFSVFGTFLFLHFQPSSVTGP